MRRIFAIILLIATPVLAIAGPVIPSADDRRNLEAAIKSITMVRAQDQANGKGIMQGIEEIIGLRDGKGKLLRPLLTDPNYNDVRPQDMERELGLMREFDASMAERFAKLSVQQRAEYDAATKAHKRYQEELRPLCEQALKLAQKAFHISPRNPDGTIVNGPPPPETDDDLPSFQGKHAVWKPVYHETQDPNNRGFTNPDGHVGITLEAFRDSDRLGFVLYHESLHFDDLLDAAKDVKNDPAGEVRHREGAKRLIGSVFKLQPDDIENNDKVIGYEMSRAERWRELMSNGLDPWKKSLRAAFPGNYKSLRMKDRTMDYDGAYLGRPEPTKEQADMSFLDSWRQAMSAMVDAKARAMEQARLDKERLEREGEEQERANRERKKQDFREEMDAEAASCGYSIRYDADKAMLGFHGSLSYRYGRNQVPFDFGDLKVVFLMTHACNEIERRPHEPAPRACNSAAPLLNERVSRGDFVPKLKYLASTEYAGDTYVDGDRCLQELLNNAGRITDTQSFNVVVASYQKRLSKRLAEEAKSDAEREKRERRRNRGGGGTRPPPPSDDQDYIWNTGCECWIRRQ